MSSIKSLTLLAATLASTQALAGSTVSTREVHEALERLRAERGCGFAAHLEESPNAEPSLSLKRFSGDTSAYTLTFWNNSTLGENGETVQLGCEIEGNRLFCRDFSTHSYTNLFTGFGSSCHLDLLEGEIDPTQSKLTLKNFKAAAYHNGEISVRTDQRGQVTERYCKADFGTWFKAKTTHFSCGR